MCDTTKRLLALLQMLQGRAALYGDPVDADDAVLDAWFGPHSRLACPQATTATGALSRRGVQVFPFDALVPGSAAGAERPPGPTLR